jgi:hypothetical protein
MHWREYFLIEAFSIEYQFLHEVCNVWLLSYIRGDCLIAVCLSLVTHKMTIYIGWRVEYTSVIGTNQTPGRQEMFVTSVMRT